MKDKTHDAESNNHINRRSALKGMAAVPLLGLFTYDYWKKKTLENGLRVVVVPMPQSLTATILVLTATGSKYETKDISGVSHFLEH